MNVSKHTEDINMASIENYVSLLRCPASGQRLQLSTIEAFETTISGDCVSLRSNHLDKGDDRFGPTAQVLVREDMQRAYPIVDDIPVLLAPEALGCKNDRQEFDLSDARYAEAYEEMGPYNLIAGAEAKDIRNSTSFDIVSPVANATDDELSNFPNPRSVWLDATYDCAGQFDAYNYIKPIQGKRVIQLGGKGSHAVKFALGGSFEAFGLSPMLGETQCGRAIARETGVEDRFCPVVAVAEELPFADDIFDAAYTGGSLHHMVTEVAIPEIVRVLRDGGRFASIDMWKAPLYTVGTRVLGKREVDINCKPLTKDRVAPLKQHFSSAEVVQHGTLSRYPFLALQKFGRATALETVWKINLVDDKLCSVVPGMRSMGSSVVSMGEK